MTRTLLSFALLAFSAFAAAADYNNHITIKTGNFDLDNTSQVILSGTSTFTEGSNSVFGFEYERTFLDTFSWGVEVFAYENTYTRSGSTGLADAAAVMFNVRKYFEVSSVAHPYVGFGIGSAGVDMTGPIVGTATDTATQFMGGVIFPLDRLSVFLEYKKLSADITDDYGTTIDMTGTGTLLGVTINF